MQSSNEEDRRSIQECIQWIVAIYLVVVPGDAGEPEWDYGNSFYDPVYYPKSGI